ncbi:MAG: peptidylprolyl isomerase [Gammaproteobacteria bacterium]|nr:peptidylprolyl isomerase [Gammaproteobacteria bacterium]NIM73244.1 peptidylprolyl isomerase [Gammaproteobacteria bacterium]NIN39063.1 peptidylprolyl isomerase [Gammaproteobacteria bacterium]NIO24945.1 peptidylprolyl isomerase [Gammaproteobacteria bacterium]NIO65547.1 peptidylprolyl isomerase [Gammaproteobacteria bacterium]
MLQSIRDHATGWIAWIIVILISIPFALWGIHEYLSPTSNVAVASVNGTDIGTDQFQRVYQRQRAQLQSILGPSFDINQLDEERLREEALNQLINDEILLQTALVGGMRIGDRQLARAIQTQEIFQESGNFSEALYQQWLRVQGYSAGGFENDLKRSLLTEQLVAGIATSAIVTAHDLDNAIRLQRQKRTIDTLTVPLSRFEDVKIDEAAMRAHYEANQADYVAPEQVKLKYIEISRDAIAAGIAVDEDELRAVYERRKADMQTPEQREASHILITLDDEADEAAVAAARERLAGFKQQIAAGASFADLAREHSQDPGSAGQGGSLGAFGRGVMDPAFEEAAFSLAAGEVSDPVRSAFGMHLIRVDAITPSKLPSFEEVRDALRAEYQNERAEQRFVEMLDIMATMAFETPDSLDGVAQTLGLVPSVTDWLSPQASSNSGIGSIAAVVAAAFNPDVLRDGFNSEPIELDPGRVVVVRMADHRPASQQPFEEVRERIERELADREARRLAAETGRALLERLEAGEDKRRVADETGLAWSGDSELERVSANVDPGVRNTAFRLARPAPGSNAFGASTTAGGDFVIVDLKQVIDGTLDDDEQSRSAARRQLEVDAGRTTYDSVVETLRSNADVVLFRDNL